MLYFEFIKLQVRIYEFTGDIIGVIVEIWLWFVACTVAGYVCAVIPIRLPKAVPNVVAWAGHATYGIFLAWVTGCSGTSTGAVFGVSSI